MFNVRYGIPRHYWIIANRRARELLKVTYRHLLEGSTAWDKLYEKHHFKIISTILKG